MEDSPDDGDWEVERGGSERNAEPISEESEAIFRTMVKLFGKEISALQIFSWVFSALVIVSVVLEFLGAFLNFEEKNLIGSNSPLLRTVFFLAFFANLFAYIVLFQSSFSAIHHVYVGRFSKSKNLLLKLIANFSGFALMIGSVMIGGVAGVMGTFYRFKKFSGGSGGFPYFELGFPCVVLAVMYLQPKEKTIGQARSDFTYIVAANGIFSSFSSSSSGGYFGGGGGFGGGGHSGGW